MSFEIIWSDFAETELDKIFEYYVEHASLKVAKNLLDAILSEPNKLVENPEITQVEDLLLDREIQYRYLLCKNYKLIYSIDYEHKLLKITDVFDTRQKISKFLAAEYGKSVV